MIDLEHWFPICSQSIGGMPFINHIFKLHRKFDKIFL